MRLKIDDIGHLIMTQALFENACGNPVLITCCSEWLRYGGVHLNAIFRNLTWL